jgi:hypothetical protein
VVLSTIKTQKGIKRLYAITLVPGSLEEAKFRQTIVPIEAKIAK